MINTDTENNKIEFIGKDNIKNFKKHEFYINDATNNRIVYFGDDGKEKITNNLYLESVQVIDNSIIFSFNGAEEVTITTNNTLTGNIDDLNKYLYFDADYNIFTEDQTILNTRIIEFISVIAQDYASQLDQEYTTPVEPEPEQEPSE